MMMKAALFFSLTASVIATQSNVPPQVIDVLEPGTESVLGCSAVQCAQGSFCVETPVQCIRAPCPVKAECIQKQCPVYACTQAIAACESDGRSVGFTTTGPDAGCPTCDCCPMLQCPDVCANGAKRDENGCDTCECSISCPEMLCLPGTTCPNGFQTDPRGCQTCTCKPIDECPEIMCAMWCQHGYVLDKRGCKTCKCNTETCVVDSIKRSDDGCNTCACTNGPNTNIPDWVCTEMACETPSNIPARPKPTPETCKIEFENAFGWFSKPADPALALVAQSPREGVCTRELAQLISTGEAATDITQLELVARRIKCTDECLAVVKRATYACEKITLSYQGMTGTFAADDVIDAARTTCGLNEDVSSATTQGVCAAAVGAAALLF